MVQENWQHSVLLNNIDKYVKRGQFWPFRPWQMTFRVMQANQSFWINGTNMSKCVKNGKISPFRPWKMTFRAIQPNLSFDTWFMSSHIPKKLPVKKRNKRPPLSNNTLSMMHSPMNTQWPWFDFSMPPMVKCHGVNWKTIYDLLYMCFMQNLIRYNLVKVMWPWFDLEMLSKVKCLEVNW